MLRSQLDNFDDNDVYGLACADPSLAVQSQRDEADINTIVRRFGLSGQLPSNVRVPLEADFVDIMDFKDAQNAIILADRSFNAMPADVRSRFSNNAAVFVEFCTAERVDPETGKVSLANIDEMRKFGLAVAAPAVVAALVPEVLPPAG